MPRWVHREEVVVDEEAVAEDAAEVEEAVAEAVVHTAVA